MKSFEEIRNETSQFIRDVELEAKRITWPTKNDALKSTLAVLLITAFFAMFFALVDYLFSLLFGFILS